MSSKEGEVVAKKNGRRIYNLDAQRRSRHLAPGVIGVCLVVILAWSMALVLVPGARASAGPFHAALKVPSQYPTIQSAINAAHSGDTILVAPGTYIEQLTITKSVTIMGSGAGKTIIQSPAVLKPDAFGNPWTIELGNAAMVTLSGFTLLVTLQCIINSTTPASIFESQLGYAGGGIGVGGRAFLNLESAVVATTGATEGASCGGPSPAPTGFLSYGTGVDFGLDYLTGSPAALALVGFGTVSEVRISGFGFGGSGISVGGEANSPSGSYALISNDQVTTKGTVNVPCCAAPLPVGVSVGHGGNASSATIVHNTLTGVQGTISFPIDVGFGSSAYIAHNSITATGWANGVSVFQSSSATITDNSIVIGTAPPKGDVAWGIYVESSWATITYNSITGPSVDGVGIFLLGSSATVEFNSISQMECEYNPTLGGPCGPSWATQLAGYGIIDYSDAGLGTTIANNLIFSTDVGILLWSGCLGCVVKDNVLVSNLDYGLAGIDGSYSFSQNLVVGGLYGAASIASTVDTTVTLSHVAIVGTFVAPFYTEADFSGGSATINGA